MTIAEECVTIEDLEQDLIDCRCSLSIHQGEDGWTVWLYDPENAFLLACTRSDELRLAIDGAFCAWGSVRLDAPEKQEDYARLAAKEAAKEERESIKRKASKDAKKARKLAKVAAAFAAAAAPAASVQQGSEPPSAQPAMKSEEPGG